MAFSKSRVRRQLKLRANQRWFARTAPPFRCQGCPVENRARQDRCFDPVGGLQPRIAVDHVEPLDHTRLMRPELRVELQQRLLQRGCAGRQRHEQTNGSK